MGAVVCSEKVAVPKGKHGTTFGGNPLSCAAALAAIGFMQENDLAAEAHCKGDYLVSQLQQPLRRVREIRTNLRWNKRGGPALHSGSGQTGPPASPDQVAATAQSVQDEYNTRDGGDASALSSLRGGRLHLPVCGP